MPHLASSSTPLRMILLCSRTSSRRELVAFVSIQDLKNGEKEAETERERKLRFSFKDIFEKRSFAALIRFSSIETK